MIASHVQYIYVIEIDISIWIWKCRMCSRSAEGVATIIMEYTLSVCIRMGHLRLDFHWTLSNTQH